MITIVKITTSPMQSEVLICDTLENGAREAFQTLYVPHNSDATEVERNADIDAAVAAIPSWETPTEEILPSSLTAEQRARCHAMAKEDAAHWAEATAAGNLPEVETMHLDWQVDADLRDAGVDSEMLQRLSFSLATQNASVWMVELTQKGNEHYTREYPTQRAAIEAARTEWSTNRKHPDFTAGGENRATWTVYRVLPDGGRSHVTEFRADAR